jgi:hypothetical protein
MEKPEPQKEHRWLQRLVGEWTFEAEGPEKMEGIERVRSIGELWTIAEGEGPAGDGTHASIFTFGYDPQKQRFVGTFISSMMTHLWLYDGALDAAGRVLTLDSEGPSMTGDGKLARYRDSIEWLSDHHRVLQSEMQQDDGSWKLFMKMHYRRTR